PVRRMLDGQLHRRLAVGSLAHHLQPVRLEHFTQTFAEQRLIVGDENADHSGNSTSSVKPWPRPLRIATLPPTLSALSRRPTSPKPWPTPSAPIPSSSTRRRTPLLREKAHSIERPEPPPPPPTFATASSAPPH